MAKCKICVPLAMLSPYNSSMFSSLMTISCCVVAGGSGVMAGGRSHSPMSNTSIQLGNGYAQSSIYDEPQEDRYRQVCMSIYYSDI